MTDAPKQRREKGTGGLRFRPDKNLWEATVDFGTRPVYDAHGHPVLDAEGRPKTRRDRRIVYGRTEAAAKKRKEEMEKRRAGGALEANATVADFLALWLAHLELTLAPESPRSYVSFEATVRLHIRPAVGHIRLAKLAAADVERMIATIRDKGAGPRNPDAPAPAMRRTAIYARNTLRTALNWGIKHRMVDRNEAALADVPEDRPRKAATLSVEDARRIIAAPHRYRVLWLLALTTGLRQSELIGLRWEDVDLAHGTLRVSQQIQRITGQGLVARGLKTDASHADVLLAPFVTAALREHRAKRSDALVFVSGRGTPVDHGNLQRQWRTHLGKLGIPYVHFHAATRHTCATLLYAEGVDLRIIQSVLRHTRIATTSDIYTHLAAGAQRAATDAMERLFGDTANVPPIEGEHVRDVRGEGDTDAE